MAKPAAADAAPTRRLFFALWPDAALQAAMAEAARAVASTRAIGGRAVPAERLHLTLLFLGDVAARTEQHLIEAAGAVTGRSFHLSLEQAACFYRTRVFWLGPKATPPRLTTLWQGLRRIAASHGVATEDRPLAPHVTCLRDIRDRIRPVPIRPILWPVREFALVHSEPGPTPRYHVVSQWPLQTASTSNVKTVQGTEGPE